jgi:nucleotide-binding universal stress UspA family protein
MASGGRLRRFLVGFDGSEEAKQAVELALDLGEHLGAELTLFSVLPDTSHLETVDARKRAERGARAQLDEHLASARLRAASMGVSLTDVEVIGGDPADQIARYAAVHGFDLVVIGSHGRERTTHGGLGRVVERLLRNPRCPVLVASEPASS